MDRDRWKNLLIIFNVLLFHNLSFGARFFIALLALD